MKKSNFAIRGEKRACLIYGGKEIEKLGRNSLNLGGGEGKRESGVQTGGVCSKV